MLRIAVLDSSTLINLTSIRHLHIFNHLQSIFLRIHVPSKVKSEYEVMLKHEPDRAWFLEKLRPNKGFYSYCTQYDSIVLSMIQPVKHIDAGEAEAVAQLKKVNASYILSDDERFSKALKTIDPFVKVISTLHILAMLDLSKVILNSDEIIQALYNKNPFPKSRLRNAYMDCYKEFGIKHSKKHINQKCELIRI
jgi:predicted nucleic acid-binding protein